MTDDREIEVHDISPRLFTVPVGTTFVVPDDHEWHLMAMSVLPTRGYEPPLGAGESRNAQAWGDLQIRVDDNPNPYFRTNVLTLIDRYWGRFNLNPLLPQLAAQLTAAQQAMYTAPKIASMYTLMDHLTSSYAQYLNAAAPQFEMPLHLKGGARFTIEHVASDSDTATTLIDKFAGVDVDHLRALDVELSTIIKRPVSINAAGIQTAP